MREVLFSDLTVAVRALLAVPPHLRQAVCAQLLCDAECADKFTKRLGKPHKRWGNGTLAAAARSQILLSERAFSDPEYASCVMLVLQALSDHRKAKACKSRLHAHIKN